MINFFKELFDFNNHVNQLLIARLIENSGVVSEKAFQLQSHIINAHQIWNSRLLDEVPFGVFEIHQPTKLQEMDNGNYQKSLGIIRAKDLSETFQYTNTKGQTFINSVRDILFHIINHSTYHRAQIATEFRQSGVEPLVTDYIFYKRDEKR